MNLATLDKYQQIVIQVHDNPDADAVGAGYTIYRYFQDKGKDVRLVYGGRYAMSKSNMLLLVDELEIPIEYVQELDNPELLLTVDCQYGQGNVQHFEAQNVAMIDHHSTGRQSDDMAEIRSHLVSCSTVCYALLKSVGYDVNADKKMATALYYGLYMDSNQLTEINHPFDRDMVDFLQYDKPFVNRLKYANLSIVDFETAGLAITRHRYVEKNRLAIITTRECDPNILGLIGDLALQVDSIDVCLVFCEYPGGYKLSVRSCALEVAANELAGFLTTGIGNGGGHIDKAGAFISEESYRKVYGDKTIEAYFYDKMDEYYDNYEVVYFDDGMQEKESFKLYQKKANILGYVKTTDLFPEGTECKIRTLEGDAIVLCDEEVYVMVGFLGETYPISRKAFETKYDVIEGVFEKEFEYPPTIINMETGQAFDMMPYVRLCKSQPGASIYAKPVTKHTKVFSRWNYETYMNGEVGDLICYSANDLKDVYIVKKDIFDILYQEIQA